MSQRLECPCNTKIKCSFDRNILARHKNSRENVIKVVNENQCKQCHKVYSTIGNSIAHF